MKKPISKNILLCGNRSFVAKGLLEKLSESGHTVDGFSRGETNRDQTQVTGNVVEINSNQFLKPEYDLVINFILLKEESIAENIEYVKNLVDFCKTHKVKNLIHISTIMVYDNKEFRIDEKSKIENNSQKKGYGEIKIAVDKYLESLHELPFSITYIRPGFVIADDRQVPFIKPLPFGFTFIKGNNNSIMPIVKRNNIHQAILNLLELKSLPITFLFVPSNNKTKFEYAKEMGRKRFVFPPKCLVLNTVNILQRLRFIPKSFYVRVEGMYIETQYNSRETESILNIKF